MSPYARIGGARFVLLGEASQKGPSVMPACAMALVQLVAGNLASEMRAYRDDQRKGGDTITAAALYGVSDADIRAIAHFLSRQP